MKCIYWTVRKTAVAPLKISNLQVPVNPVHIQHQHMWFQQLSEPEFENAPGMMRTLDARDRGFCDEGGMGRTRLATANCAGQMPLNGPKEASCASLHRRPPESAPEADRPKSAPHASALGRVGFSLSTVQVPMRLPLPGPLVRPAVRRHGVPLHMVVLARSATCVVLSKKTV